MKKILAVLLLTVLLQSAKRVSAQADESGLKVRDIYSVGASYTFSSTDWAGASMQGFTVWGDGEFFRAFNRLNRIAVEAEYKDIQFGRPAYESRLKFQTVQAGLNVGLFSWHRIRPYGKGLVGVGAIDYPLGSIVAEPTSTGKHNLVYSLGGGADYHATRRVNVRVEYYSQFWPNLADRGTALTPHGWNVGGAYRF